MSPSNWNWFRDASGENLGEQFHEADGEGEECCANELNTLAPDIEMVVGWVQGYVLKYNINSASAKPLCMPIVFYYASRT